ncbi:hypothetical protein [Bradyrhizobium sp. AUGA SZCCT0182]|uniref:hypothetical protein n=1 Tax=Bradyrhizobium sp. AUGA SZCCT0182 TaxID=2807667 RepID=UPI00289A2B90|nr:hypothetical protein [Bradyrhizobium sp. AUGA SZCCT0182]
MDQELYRAGSLGSLRNCQCGRTGVPTNDPVQLEGWTMSGGKAPRQRGNREERAIVRYLQDQGFAAERVPLSGSAGGSYLGDLTVPILEVDRVVEVKVRANGFRQLYNWLIDRDILIVRANRSEPLVVLPLKLAAEIASAADKNKLRIERVMVYPTGGDA